MGAGLYKEERNLRCPRGGNAHFASYSTVLRPSHKLRTSCYYYTNELSSGSQKGPSAKRDDIQEVFPVFQIWLHCFQHSNPSRLYDLS